MKRASVWVGLVVMLVWGSAFAQSLDDPQKVVMQTAEKVLAEVSERKLELEADPSLIYPLVQRTVLPHFDFNTMARSAMGRFWRKATPQQQRRLVAEFRELLVRTYATALLNYSGQRIEYPPMNYADGAQDVMVPTKISTDGGPPVPVNYRLHTNEKANWLVYDVVIDGVSLVTNYRSTFARQIQLGAAQATDRSQRMSAGIDYLIDTLASKNDDPGK